MKNIPRCCFLSYNNIWVEFNKYCYCKCPEDHLSTFSIVYYRDDMDVSVDYLTLDVKIHNQCLPEKTSMASCPRCPIDI
jgi:hypothetical protein